MPIPTLCELEEELIAAANRWASQLLIGSMAAANGQTSAAINVRITASRLAPLVQTSMLLREMLPPEWISAETCKNTVASDASLHLKFLNNHDAPEPPNPMPDRCEPTRLFFQVTDEVPDPLEGVLDLRLDESEEQTRFLCERIAARRTRPPGNGGMGLGHDYPRMRAAILNRTYIQGEPLLVNPVRLPDSGPLPSRMPETLDLINRLAIGATALTGRLDDDGFVRGETDLPRQVASLLIRAGAAQPGLELSPGVNHFFELVRVLNIRSGALSALQIVEQLNSTEFQQQIEVMVADGEIKSPPRDRPWSYRDVLRKLHKLDSRGYVQRTGPRTQYTWSVPIHYREAGMVNTLELLASQTIDNG
ncbi:MAG: hypothetical protein ACE37H_03575 [Phycisphaeraceae bacterium]